MIPLTPLPTGTVTFLFTDIEGSTALLQRLGDRLYAEVLAEHQRLLRDAFDRGNGQEIDTQGDAFLVVFSRARDAVETAVRAQRALAKHAWPGGSPLRVRMGVHTGEPLSRQTGYVGVDVHRAARIAAAGHGGQILVSDATHGLVVRDLPQGVRLRDLGEHRLKDLAHPHYLFQVEVAGLPSDFPPIRSLDVLPNNLPRQLTSFIGREKEMAEVKRLLSTAYLVTLTGSGGAGKTRLALQVAADVVEDYRDGVWLAEFAPVADPALVPKTVASTLNVPEQPERELIGTLVAALRAKALLLVLDSCEHLLAACRDLAAALLRTCPQVRLLATSREGLGIPGETLWRVPSLSMPEEILPRPEELVLYDALRLFVDRAVATTPGFTVTSENALAVAQVCRRLDGIPLAIELAAARVKVLAVDQIAARLDDRFRLLTGGSRMVLPRHRTLRAAIDWSYGLLSERERAVLRRLSVFAGGWTLEAAEAVCTGGGIEASDVLDLLTQLVDKSLVVAQTHGGEARYQLLETVREYGRERLHESEAVEQVQRRHRDWYLALTEQVEPKLEGRERETWLDRLERENDNLRAALDWSLEHRDADAVMRLANSLYRFWDIRGYWSEGLHWLEAALSLDSGDPSPMRARALDAAGALARLLGDTKRAVARLEETVGIYRVLGDKKGMANALLTLGIAAYRQSDYDRAAALLEESTALSRASGDNTTMAFSIYLLGILARVRGDYGKAETLCKESLTLSQALGLKWRAGLALDGLGLVALCQGDYERAKSLFQRALDLHEQEGYRYGQAASLNSYSIAAYVQGEYERAGVLSEQSLALSRKTGDKGAIARSLSMLGRVASRQGNFKEAVEKHNESLVMFRDLGERLGIVQALERLGSVTAASAPIRAARLLAAATSVRETIGAPLPAYDRAEHDTAVDQVRAVLDSAVFSAAWADGRAMTLEQAVEYALDEAQ
jgi:predicted ATPase/class 3 adenylate cyclase